MCGIFGHVGSERSFEKCIEGLRLLEYRGYDSAGIAGVEDGQLICYKEKGKIADLEKSLERKIHRAQSAIGHTRWATHGKASKTNAHPHLDQSQTLAIVHNGILENYRSLRTMLEEAGGVFVSDTDSEVIVQLIAHFYKGDLMKAVRRATSLMKGFWGLAVLHRDHPGQILATALENPIVVGIDGARGEAFISSDPYAFNGQNLDLYFLENHQIALVGRTDVKLFDVDDRPISATPKQLALDGSHTGKGEFEHFMLKEIVEQPQTIASAMQGRFSTDLGEIVFEDTELSDKMLQSVRSVLILGCGSSWHAGLIGKQQLQEIARMRASAEIASEFRYQGASLEPQTLVIALSQSGETFDTLAAARKAKRAGAKVLAVCNIPNSTLMREADYGILLRAGPEISVCSTKAFTSQLTVLSLFALKCARLKQMGRDAGQTILHSLLSLPQVADKVLAQRDTISAIAEKIAPKTRFLFLGRQYMLPTCFEAALKLKELAYVSAAGYPAGELKHGPIASIDASSVVIALMGNQTTYEKMVSNLEEVKAREGTIVAFAPQGSTEIAQIADHVIHLPYTIDPLAPLPYSIAAQLLAYDIACTLGREIDQPRNLAKSVTVE